MRVIGTLRHENEAQKFSRYLSFHSILNTMEANFHPSTNEISYEIWIHDDDQIPEAQAAFEEFLKHPNDPKFETSPEEVEEEEIPSPPPHRYGNRLTLFLIALCSFIFFLTMLPDEEVTPLLMFNLPEILQGQVWRLFTPCLLHIDFLHLLFNMLWLWVLGRPIEQRIGPFRTLVLTLLAGVISNVAQYAVSGPLFMGYSGIVTALAGFIWMREKKAPWEGYPLNKATLLFLLLFIGSILLLQIAAYFIQVFTSYNFAPRIANTAHIVGALVGILLARFSYFAQKVHR
jgi:GlpG protein